MAQFSPAFEYLMDDEDRSRDFTEIIDNNGGKVIAGINSKSYPEDEAAIAALPIEQRSAAVKAFYEQEFWNPLKAGGIESQDVANRYQSAAVNCGIYTAVQMLQNALLAIGTPVVVDGHIGPNTLAAANSVDPERLLAAFRDQWEGHYRDLAARFPDKYAKFVGTPEKPGGWIKRARA